MERVSSVQSTKKVSFFEAKKLCVLVHSSIRPFPQSPKHNHPASKPFAVLSTPHWDHFPHVFPPKPSPWGCKIALYFFSPYRAARKRQFWWKKEKKHNEKLRSITILEARVSQWCEEPPAPRVLGCPRPKSLHGGVLTIAPEVGSHGPILQPCEQVLGAVPQAEDGLHARAFAGQQALRPRVHAAVDHDAEEGTWWGDGRRWCQVPPGLVLGIAPKGGCRRRGLTCHPVSPGTRWDAGMPGAVQWWVGVLGCPLVPPHPPQGCTPCTAPVKPPGRTSPSAARHG